MERHIGVATVVLVAVVAVGCEQPQPSAPTLTRPLFAAATTTPVMATVTLAITAPGKQWLSDSIAHIRDQTQSGSVSGDLTGTATVMGRSDVAVATMDGTASGKFTITATAPAVGAFEGSFAGTYTGGVFSGKIVGQGTGAFAGQILRGTISQAAPNMVYTLTGTILNPGG
jgi:hypothetical protein